MAQQPSNGALPAPLPRRVSYVLPPPSKPPPLLSLPPASSSRRGHTAPLFSVRPGELPQAYVDRFHREQDTDHPRHRLAVQALALDLSTSLSGGSSSRSSQEDAAPNGLLYTGGRDGLLCSWELDLPTKRRRRGYGRRATEDDAVDLRAESDSDGSDDDMMEASAATNGLDLDGLGRRPLSAVSQRRQSAKSGPRPRRASSRTSAFMPGFEDEEAATTLPIEDRYQVDDERLKSGPSPTTKFRQCIQSHTDVSWCMRAVNQMLM